MNNTRKKPKPFDIPSGYHPAINFYDAKRQCESWKSETGCDIMPYFTNGKLVRFDIFAASANQFDETTRIIKKWIIKVKDKSRGSALWAKLPAHDANKWYYEQVATLEDERKKGFMGDPRESLPSKVRSHCHCDWLYTNICGSTSSRGPRSSPKRTSHLAMLLDSI